MYKKNHVPALNMKSSTTGCCPKFDPSEWDGQTFDFADKTFVKVSTRSFLFMPLNMSSVMTKTWKSIEDAGAKDADEFIMMSQDVSPWKADHYFATTKEVDGLENVTISGQFKTKVFEGPFKDAQKWCNELDKIGKAAGVEKPEQYLYYTTCPKCAKVYGKNYVVGLVKIG